MLQIEATALTNAIEESLQYFELLKYTLSGNRKYRHIHDFKTINEKYGVEDEIKFLFREEIGLPPLIPKYSQKLISETY